FRAFLAQRHRIRRCRDRHGTGVDGDRTTSRTHTAILVRDSELQREDARSIIVCAADTEPGTALVPLRGVVPSPESRVQLDGGSAAPASVTSPPTSSSSG